MTDSDSSIMAKGEIRALCKTKSKSQIEIHVAGMFNQMTRTIKEKNNGKKPMAFSRIVLSLLTSDFFICLEIILYYPSALHYHIVDLFSTASRTY